MNTNQRVTDFSSLSVISSVDKFIKTVDTMNETVMVPSRLLNVEIPSKGSNVPALLKRNTADPYTFYTVLNNARTDLVWGLSEADDNDNDESENKFICDNSAWFVQCSEGKNTTSTTTTVSPSDSSSKGHTKGHARKISSVSSGSVASCLSEQECERLSDAGGDSGVESEEHEPVENITEALKMHLSGLQKCLFRLTETAIYITDKYQEELSA